MIAALPAPPPWAQNPEVPEATAPVPQAPGAAPPTGTASPVDPSRPQAPQEPGSPFGMLWMVLLMIGVMYFLMWRPEKKRQAALAKLRSDLKKGDRVATSAGILGTVAGLADDVVTVEVADKIRIQFQRAAITQVLDGKEKPEPAAAK